MFLQVKQAAGCQQHGSASQSRTGIHLEKCRNQEVSEGFSEAFPEWKTAEANKECYSAQTKLELAVSWDVTKTGMNSHVGCRKEIFRQL